MHKREDFDTPERWEAHKAKLGKVIEVEAANQSEAWQKYDVIKQGKV